MRISAISLLIRATACVVGVGAFLISGSLAARAQEAGTGGKTITMLIGFPVGGSTDLAGRLMAQFLTKHLPGSPTIIVQNMPGADGKAALNYFVRTAAPDGMMITTGSGSQLDPRNYRTANTQYDPAKFRFVGGVSRGGTFQIISKKSLPRLTDKNVSPVVIGAIDGTRSGEEVIAWGIELLNWNAKWVVGYRTSVETVYALERNEVDIASVGSSILVRRLTDTGQFVLLSQSGTVVDGKMRRRSDFAEVPMMAELIAGKLATPDARDAFSFLESMALMDPWIALPGGTPDAIVAQYREAFQKTATNPSFLEMGKSISEDIRPMYHADFEWLVRTTAEKLTPGAESFMQSLREKQGIRPKQ